MRATRTSQTAQQEDSRHDGNDLLRNGGQTLHAAEEDNAADDDQDHDRTTQVGMLKAVFMVEPMELDCTMQPMKPSARTMATAKKPARNLPKPPLNAVVM